MQTKQSATPVPTNDATAGEAALDDAIRNYVRAYALWHGRPQAARRFGVSRHTLWRLLERGRLGRSLPRAVTGAVAITHKPLKPPPRNWSPPPGASGSCCGSRETPWRSWRNAAPLRAS